MMLLALYGWTLAAGTVAAPALALLGAQLATRDRALQTLCVSQGGLLGVLLGLGALPESSLVPFLGALAVSAATFALTEQLVSARMASRNTAFAFVFSLLLAGGYLVAALFPSLESHMTQIYLGDLATITETASRFLFLGFGIALLLLVRFRRRFSNGAFESALFGETGTEPGFRLLALAMLCLSVQYLGFLFTVTMLFLPTAMLRLLPQPGVRLHLRLAALLAASGTLLGFVLSLQFTRLPTVPTIAWVLFFLTGAVVVILRRAQNPRIIPSSAPAKLGRCTPPATPYLPSSQP